MTTKPKHATVMYAYDDPDALGEPDFGNQDTVKQGPWKHETYCFTPEQFEKEREEIAKEAAEKAWQDLSMRLLRFEIGKPLHIPDFETYWKTQGGEDEKA